MTDMQEMYQIKLDADIKQVIYSEMILSILDYEGCLATWMHDFTQEI